MLRAKNLLLFQNSAAILLSGVDMGVEFADGVKLSILFQKTGQKTKTTIPPPDSAAIQQNCFNRNGVSYTRKLAHHICVANTSGT